MKCIRQYLARRRLTATVRENVKRLAMEQARQPRRRDGRFSQKDMTCG